MTANRKSARFAVAAALSLALAACGSGSEGEEFAPGNSQLNQVQIDAALGPADQTMVQDALPGDNLQDEAAPTGNATANEASEDEE